MAGRLYAAIVRWFVPDLDRCFDAADYLDRYPDVRQSGFPPLAHFLLFGGREGRQPNALFDAKSYLASNPDVAAAGANPLVHFLRYGWKEGRLPNRLFDAAFYESRYPDRAYRNPFVDYVVRRRNGERLQAWLPFRLPHQSYQVATTQLLQNNPLRPVDLVIPVYSGLEETRRCLHSILGAACQTAHHIVLIDDCSPDSVLRQYLRDLAAAHAWTLLENSENLGFAASVNRGMELHPDRDVLLLNNDTEVANDWLDRLAAAAYRTSRTGTATPFSNHAAICTYPLNKVAAAELDAVFRQVNAGCRVDLPTAVGFCMYIRRDCLNEAGLFRPEIFGKGYGEENDFCLRATYKGWSHALACDTFVYHAGETSFGAEAESRRKAGAEAVKRLYPEYGRMIASHLRHDPAKPYRVAISAWRMKHSGRPVILAISHGLGGGVEQYIGELRQMLSGHAAVLALTPGGCGAVALSNLDPDDPFTLAFDSESDYDALVDLLRGCGVSRIHVHHLLGHTLDPVQLQHDLKVPMDLSIHDYFLLCPQVTLTDAAGRYCGEPDASGCNACLALRPPLRDRGGPCLDIELWRQKYACIASHADRVLAPSQDAANRFRRYFPQANILVAPHPSPRSEPPSLVTPLQPDQPLVIAVLGVMNLHKGIARLRAVANLARRRNLPLRFVLAGYVDPPHSAGEPFVQTGRYRSDQLAALLQDAGAHLAWFPAQWPETFSYTLSACLELGLPVVAPDIGAFAERLAGRSWSWTVPWDWDQQRMIEFFLSVRRDHFLTGAPPAPQRHTGTTRDADFYPVAYLSP